MARLFSICSRHALVVVAMLGSGIASGQEFRASQEFRITATGCTTYNNKALTVTFAGADNVYSFTNVTFNNYGQGVITSVADAPTQIVYKFCVSPAASWYKMSVRYAAAERRPVNIDLNGTSLGNDLLGYIRGNWNPGDQQWESIGFVQLKSGTSPGSENTLTINRSRAFPHISQIMFEPSPPQ
jgi:hypothetical protein